ncbi:F-box protein At3g07870-like [Solanum lycopersicum]|uniref:F-box domain-containing protein n=1 Tax=Solanum lycopersicum TaxID=4081 RepID=A0A3Q7IR18_SOLLC|nr:F-box protein At3g07870-like [Solanum lycopersicum]XP_010312575.1 F-box protein At3g07870-like [Solanum lycopersicum]XP_019066407.1 F-box protein At3g07870-like [Solanum lycopersicum]
MILDFFTWLGSLVETICKGSNVVDDDDNRFERLPDCLVIDILSRLPSHSFLRCRWVCRHWRALLVSSQHSFTNIHHLSRHTTPMFIIHEDLAKYDAKSDFAKHGQDVFVYNENKKIKKKKKVMFQKLHLKPELRINKDKPCLLYSCEGVLVFVSSKWKSTYYIVNPITQEELTVRYTPGEVFVCALYFCPYTRQFRVLIAQLQDTCCTYFVHIVKIWKCEKIHSSISFNFLPNSGNPAVVNGALHWITLHDLKRKGIAPCENGIMVFRMDKEELFTMPHPPVSKVCKSNQDHLAMKLMVKDDHLCLCNMILPWYIVDMWWLEDYETRSWIKRYKINLLNERIFPFSKRLSEREIRHRHAWNVKFLYLQEGGLLIYLIHYYGEEIYLYNLDRRTVKKLELPREKLLASSHEWALYHKSFMAIV